MKFVNWSGAFGFLVATGLVFASAGCGKDGDGKKKDPEKIAKKGEGEKGKHDHSGWWCGEHGVPEHICSLCLPEDEVKRKFKDGGDWCKLHDRADSQCFLCDPSKYAKYEAMHVAKYGTKPERPPESEFKKGS